MPLSRPLVLPSIGGMVADMSTKTVFTTGEAARICKVSQQTIIRCFDNGSLKGFRVPGSRFRRIPRDQLFQFMKDNGIPTDALESGKRKVLIVDDDEDLVELLVDVFARDGRFEIRTANNGFDAGMYVKEFRPDLVVLDTNPRVREWFPIADPGRQSHCFEWFCQEKRDNVCEECPVSRTLRDGVVHAATRTVLRDGVTRSYHQVSSPVLDEEGRVTAAIVIIEE